jgi:hypothetical protein
VGLKWMLNQVPFGMEVLFDYSTQGEMKYLISFYG